ncbi:MAG TPA: L28 family ribosomal protein [Bacilli bacterium]|nr:L28 family ribosomal protein [Bacilli bacterium]
MAKKISTRKPLFGNNRSKALNITKKKSRVNVQSVTIDGKKVITSAREAKKYRKTIKDSK